MRWPLLLGFWCLALMLVACNDVLRIRPPSEQLLAADAATRLERASNADEGQDAGQ